jgi:hypothetical protein
MKIILRLRLLLLFSVDFTLTMVNTSLAWPSASIPVLTPGPSWMGTDGCGGSCTPPPVDVGLNGSGFAETAIGNFDIYPNVVVDTKRSPMAVTVGAAIGDRGWINKVRCYLEGNTVDITTQTKNPQTGSSGWTLNVQGPPSGQNGDAVLTCDIYPVNGYVRRISNPIWIDDRGGGAGYVDRAAIATASVAGPLYADSVTGADPAGAIQATTLSTDATGLQVTFSAPVTIVPWNNYVGVVSGGKVTAWSQAAAPGTGTTFTLVRPIIPNLSGAVWTTNTTCGANVGKSGGQGDVTHPYQTLHTALNCAPSGSTVYATSGENFVEAYQAECIGGVCNGNRRMIQVLPTGSGRYTVSLLARGAFLLPAQNVLFNNAVFDMGKVGKVQGCSGGSCKAPTGSAFIFESCALNDPNGPGGPPEGYYAGKTASMWQVPFAGGFAALIDSTALTINTAGFKLVRNSSAVTTWDLDFFGAWAANTRFFNFSASQATDPSGNFLPLVQRLHIEPSVRITKPTYDSLSNQTVFTITSSEVSGLVGTGQALFVSGALANRRVPVVAFNTSTLSVTVRGDASQAEAGDLVRVWIPAHADANQIGIGKPDGPNTSWNIYEQRYRAVGRYQPFFNQPGAYPTSGTITTDGQVATLDVPNGNLRPNDFIKITSGRDIYQYRRIVSVNDPTHVVLDGAFSPDISAGATWLQAKSVVDFACVACRLGGRIGHGADMAQFQNGAIHWVFVQLTTDKTVLLFRDLGAKAGGGQGGAFGMKDFAIFDSLVDHGPQSEGLHSGRGRPNWADLTGYNFDNNHYVAISDRPGTNITGGPVTIADDTFKPTGLTHTVRGTIGNPNVPDGTPLFPWDGDGNPIAAGALVGAMQPE